jgi:hypothetical protein
MLKLHKAYNSIQSGEFVRASNLAELIGHFTTKCHGTWKAEAKLEERVTADFIKGDWKYKIVEGEARYYYRPPATEKKAKKVITRGHQRIMRSAPPALAA